jgi:hypothetical protein
MSQLKPNKEIKSLYREAGGHGSGGFLIFLIPFITKPSSNPTVERIFCHKDIHGWAAGVHYIIIRAVDRANSVTLI